MGVPGRAEHLGALGGSRAPPSVQVWLSPGIVVSGHQDNTGQCPAKGGSCMGVGLEVLCKKGQRQQGSWEA